jgi:intracellular sulfur oxidation DsrE/DsrF family protein
MRRNNALGVQKKCSSCSKAALSQIPMLISCFYDNSSTTPPTQSHVPVGFDWCKVLLNLFENKYKITLLLHGTNIKYGLNDKKYNSLYTNGNPFANMLQKFNSAGVTIKICEYCLVNEGLANKDLLSFVEPVTFAVDYIAEYQLTQNESTFKAIVIYDATINFFPTLA